MSEQGRRIHLRHLGGQARGRGQGAAGIPGTVDALREQGVGLVSVGLDDHVESFCHAQSHFMKRHRGNRLAVHGNYSHVQAGDADIKEGHGTGVDKPQLDAFTGIELAGPVGVWGLAVHQVGVGIAGDIGQVALAHAHAIPHVPVLERLDHPFVAKVPQGVEHGAFVEVVVVTQFLERGVELLRVFVAPVRQQHYLLAVNRVGIRGLRVNDDGTIQAGLFLKAGVAVVPIGAVLYHRELVGERFPRFDAIERQAGNAIHLIGQQQAVPVNRAGFRQQVGDLQRDGVAFAPAQGRPGDAAVDGGSRSGLAGEVHIGAAQGQVKGVTAQFRGAGMALTGQQLPGGKAQSQAGGTQRESLHEASARQGKSVLFHVGLQKV